MSKTMKNMIIREYKARMEGLPDAMVLSLRGLKGKGVDKFRRDLAKKNIKVTVVRNALARQAITGTSLQPLEKFLSGSSAMAYGPVPIVEMAREIVTMVQKLPEVELKGAVLDGTVFEGKKGIEELSKYPTRVEAIGQAVTLLVSPGRKLAAQVLGPGSTIAGLVKAIETKLEKGETIAKKA